MILKFSAECSADTLTSLVNQYLTKSIKFLSVIKLAHITPIYKKKDT